MNGGDFRVGELMETKMCYEQVSDDASGGERCHVQLWLFIARYGLSYAINFRFGLSICCWVPSWYPGLLQTDFRLA